MRAPALTSNEARVIHDVLIATWIPNGEKGRIFEAAVKKLEKLAAPSEAGASVVTLTRE